MSNIEKAQTQEIEKRAPLTYAEAMQKLYEAKRSIDKLSIFDYSCVHYWHHGTSLENGGEFAEVLKVYPLKGENVSTLLGIKQWVRKMRKSSRIMLGTGIGTSLITAIPVHLIANVGVEALALTLSSTIIGTAIYAYYNSRLYDGINQNIFQRAIVKMFFTKKSKKKLEANRQKFIEYKKLEEPLKAFIELTRKELERDNVFNIVNRNPSKTNGYVVLTEDGKLYKVSREEYEELNPKLLADKQLAKRDNLLEQLQIKMKAFEEAEMNQKSISA